MTIEVERLVATLEANFSKYEKSLNKAIGNTDRGFKRMEDRGRRFESQMSALGGKLKNFGIGLAAGAGLASIDGLTRALRGAVKEAADLVDMSSKIGIDTDTLQKLQFGFAQAGVDAQTVETSLTQWGKRIGEAYTAGGPLAELLKANNVSLTDGEGRLRSSVDLLADMADLIRNAGSDQERLAIAQDAFGKAGADMVLALKDGAAGMRSAADEAERLGIVLDKDVLARAAVLDDEFDKIATIIDVQIKSGLLNVADAIGVAIGFVQDWQVEIQELSKYIAAIPVIGPLSVARDIISGDPAPAPGKVGLAAGGKAFSPTAPMSDANFNARFNGPQKTIVPGKGEGGIDFSSSGSMRRGRDKARDVVDPWEDMRDAAREYADQVDAIREKHEALGETAGSSLGALVSAFEDGKLEAQELLSIVADLAVQLLKIGGGGGGGFGSFLTSLLGSVFHSGGVVGQDGAKRRVSPAAFAGAARLHGGAGIGLRHDEVASILQKGEVVLPKGTRAGGGGGRMHVTVGVDVDASGNLRPFVTSIAEGAAARSTAQLSKGVPKMVDQRNATKQIRRTRA